MCTYLTKRGAIYYFRRAIPVELRPALGGQVQFMVSLRTKDRETAKRLKLVHEEESNRLLDEAAKQTPPVNAPERPVQRVSAAQAKYEESAFYASLEAAELTYADEMAQEARREAREPIRARLERAFRKSTAEMTPDEAAAYDLVREARELSSDEQRGLEASTLKAEQRRGLVSSGRVPGPLCPLLETYDAYAKEAGIKPATKTEWRAIIERLIAFLGHNDAARITADDLYRWKEELLSETTRQGKKREPRTVKTKHLGAIRATLGWALEKRKLRTNVASDVSMRVPRKAKLRDRDFTASEAKAILKATLATPQGRFQPGTIRARRWIPWLCAYTGARVNEISQLRGQDVQQIDGIWTIRITPEAGTVKANEARIVPLHPHIIEQGFLDVVEAHGDGPLFFDPSRQRAKGEGNRHFKKVGERLALWVRDEVGITDLNLQPNHGWRHTFKTRAVAAEISERVADAIQGHAAQTVGRTYGSVPLQTMMQAVERMPRFDVS